MEANEESEVGARLAEIVPLNRENFGGDEGTRTLDPLLAKQVL
jgi:hypothetical protein